MKQRVCEWTHVISNQVCKASESSGNFHQWGTTVLNYDDGGKEVTVAIVEGISGHDHGKVFMVPPEAIRFVD